MNKWRLLLAFLAVVLVIASWRTGIFSLILDPERFRSEMRDLGPWGYVVFIVAFALLQPLGLPGLGFVVAAAFVWSRPLAYALSFAGSLASSSTGFGFARFVARDWISTRLPARLRRYDAWIERRGFLATAGLRLVFVMHPVLHAVFGISRIRFGTYILGCAVGYVIPIAVMTWASGSAIDYLKDQPKERLFWILGIVALLLLGRKIVTWRTSKRKKTVEVDPA